MMAMAVAKGTQFSQSWQAVYNLLTDSSKGLTDPQGRDLTRNEWVFSGYPDIKGSGFPNYPVVIIQSPDLRSSKLTIGGTRENDITFMISVVTDTLKDLDEVCDDVVNTLMSNKDTTYNAGLRGGSVTNSTTTTSFLEGQRKIHQKNIFMTYHWWGDF